MNLGRTLRTSPYHNHNMTVMGSPVIDGLIEDNLSETDIVERNMAITPN